MEMRDGDFKRRKEKTKRGKGNVNKEKTTGKKTGDAGWRKYETEREVEEVIEGVKGRKCGKENCSCWC